MTPEYKIVRSNRKTLAIEVTQAGEVIVRAPYMLSEAAIKKFIAKQRDWIEKKLCDAERRKELRPEPDPAEEAELRRKAAQELPARVRYYAGLMRLTPSYVRITSAKTRFGSCNAKNGLCFSWRLMQYPSEAIDYVVVHELAHIRHKNHGKEFYALISRYLPDYKERRKLLK